MSKPNLFTVYANALAGLDKPSTAPAQSAPTIPSSFRPPLPNDETLLNALRHSTTGRDQIMQRRIGLLAEAPES